MCKDIKDTKLKRMIRRQNELESIFNLIEEAGYNKVCIEYLRLYFDRKCINNKVLAPFFLKDVDEAIEDLGIDNKTKKQYREIYKQYKVQHERELKNVRGENQLLLF